MPLQVVEYIGHKSNLKYPKRHLNASEDKEHAIKLTLSKLSLMKRSGIVKTLARENKDSPVMPIDIQRLADNITDFENIGLNVPHHLITTMMADIDKPSFDYKTTPTMEIQRTTQNRCIGRHAIWVLEEAWHSNNEVLTDYIHNIEKSLNDLSGGDSKFSPYGAIVKNPAYPLHKVTRIGEQIKSVFNIGRQLGIYKENIYNKKRVDADDYRFYHSTTDGERSFYATLLEVIKSRNIASLRLKDFDQYKDILENMAYGLCDMINENGQKLNYKDAEKITERIIAVGRRMNIRADAIHRPNQLKGAQSKRDRTQAKIINAVYKLGIKARNNQISFETGISEQNLKQNYKKLIIDTKLKLKRGNC